MHFEYMPMQSIEFFEAVKRSLKIEKIQSKNFDIFNSFAQNDDCGYMFWNTKRHTPVHPKFAI